MVGCCGTVGREGATKNEKWKYVLFACAICSLICWWSGKEKKKEIRKQIA